MKKLLLPLFMSFTLFSCNNDDDGLISNFELSNNLTTQNEYLTRSSRDWFRYTSTVKNNTNKKLKFHVLVNIVSDDNFFNNIVSLKTSDYVIERYSTVNVNNNLYYLTINRLNYRIVNSKIVITDRY